MHYSKNVPAVIISRAGHTSCHYKLKTYLTVHHEMHREFYKNWIIVIRGEELFLFHKDRRMRKISLGTLETNQELDGQ